MKNLNIVIGSDHGGFELKEKIRAKLSELGYECQDAGCFDQNSVDYPIIAKEVGTKVANGEFDRGIIVCGSGVGVSIAANKVKGIRAVNCSEIYCAKMSRLHNDANVLTMGGRVIGQDVAFEIVKTWLETEFEGGRHQKRVDMIE